MKLAVVLIVTKQNLTRIKQNWFN